MSIMTVDSRDEETHHISQWHHLVSVSFTQNGTDGISSPCLCQFHTKWFSTDGTLSPCSVSLSLSHKVAFVVHQHFASVSFTQSGTDGISSACRTSLSFTQSGTVLMVQSPCFVSLSLSHKVALVVHHHLASVSFTQSGTDGISSACLISLSVSHKVVQY